MPPTGDVHEEGEVVIMPLDADLRSAIESGAFAHLTTLDPDGWPHTTAMWIDHDGEHIVFNTAKGRRKYRNLRNDPRVAISISPKEDPYRNWAIQGRVVEMRTSDGIEVIDRLAQKYLGQPKYPWLTPGMVRVTIVVEPTRIAANR